MADFWHLLHNLAEALEPLFDRLPTSVRIIPMSTIPTPTIHQAAYAADSTPKTRREMPSADEVPAAVRPPTQPQQIRQARRAKRLECFETVRRLREQGASHRAIAQQLKIGKGTVRRYRNAINFPEIA